MALHYNPWGASELMKDKGGVFSPNWLFRFKAPMWGILLRECGGIPANSNYSWILMIPWKVEIKQQLWLSRNALSPQDWGWVYTVPWAVRIQPLSLWPHLTSQSSTRTTQQPHWPSLCFSSTPRFSPFGLGTAVSWAWNVLAQTCAWLASWHHSGHSSRRPPSPAILKKYGTSLSHLRVLFSSQQLRLVFSNVFILLLSFSSPGI